MSKSIDRNIKIVQKRLIGACERAGRDPGTVRIMLATKTIPPGQILQAVRNGLKVAGENRVQEASRKIRQMGHQASKIEWHFIGHLQSNKVNKVVEFATMIQSVDRIKIVQKLNHRLEKVNKTMDVLVQVNVSGEKSKYGICPSVAIGFTEEASRYRHINIRGLMTIGLFSNNGPKVRAGFRQLRELRDKIAACAIENVRMDYLSMGMTNDFEIAIEEGADMIRLGRAIFGEREYPDSYYWPGINLSAAFHM